MRAKDVTEVPELPYADIDTLFLDAGNTLISMNFTWVAGELAELGVACTPEALERAEAAARPATSARLAGARSADNREIFVFHLAAMLGQIATSPAVEIAGRLAERIRKPGEDYRLWSRILPGVPDSLRRLDSLGLRLVVVSNSDGTVQRALEELGLAERLDAVFDSHVVGFEKPDPRLFELALSHAGAEPARTAHVGDMYYQDVEGARAAGLHSVLLDPFDDWPAVDCVRCRNLGELAERIETAHGAR